MGFVLFFLFYYIYVWYIYSFGDNQVTTENVKVTIFYKMSLNFYFLLEIRKRLKSLWFIGLNSFPINTSVKKESDSGAASVAITCFVKLHWLRCFLILGTSTVRGKILWMLAYTLLKAINLNRSYCMQGPVQLFKFMFHYLHFALNNGFSLLMKWSSREFIQELKLWPCVGTCPSSHSREQKMSYLNVNQL